MEERRKSRSKESKIKDVELLYGCDCCFGKLYAIFAGLEIEEGGFKKGVLVDLEGV